MANPPPDQTIKILGLSFSTLSAEDLVAQLPNGGLLVAPAAPALATLPDAPAYRNALEAATWIIPDSGFMALIWNLRNKQKIHRCSGLKLFKSLMAQLQKLEKSKVFLVNPDAEEGQAYQAWLTEQGIPTSAEQHYNAPHYKAHPITDSALIEQLETVKPDYILINIGGGTQELLGQYLQQNLSFQPAILCTGAAIAFLTGQQANIPDWADQICLGWLCRILASPTQYLPRYFKALRLLPIMLKEKK